MECNTMPIESRDMYVYNGKDTGTEDMSEKEVLEVVRDIIYEKGLEQVRREAALFGHWKVFVRSTVEKCWRTRSIKLVRNFAHEEIVVVVELNVFGESSLRFLTIEQTRSVGQVPRVILFGRTGNGKSSLISSIIGKYQSEKKRETGKSLASLQFTPGAIIRVETVAEPETKHLKFSTKDTTTVEIMKIGVSLPLTTKPRMENLFLSHKLSKTSCPIITFLVDLTKATNETIADLRKLGLGKVKMMHVLTAVSTSSCNDASTDVEENQKMKLILLEQRLLSSHAGSSQQSRISRELIIEFVTTLEGQLQRGLVPHSDAKMVTLLPFRADMRDYLPNMSFLVLQVSFPVSLLKKRIALLLLASRVLYTSLENSLAEVMCEDQALVMQRSSAFLVTENHAIEALIQFSQLQNIFWYIVSYNSEKCSMEMMGKVQDTLQQNFKDEFPSREFTIEPLNTCQQQPSNESTAPKEIQQIKTAVEESQSDSGQIYLLVTVKY